MTQQRIVLITILVLSFIGLAMIVGAITFRLGRNIDQPAAVNQDQSPSPEISTATAIVVAVTPPPVVTNTPTATATSTPTPTLTPTFTPTPTLTPTFTPTPIVVINHIKDMGRLQTAEFAMQTIVDLQKEPGSIWEQIVGSEKLMLVAEGEVVAGFDLEKVEADDVVVNGTTVRITLPPPEILYSRIDNERTYVYERKTGLLVTPDQTLESQARLQAEQALTAWAIERGIYDKAEEYGLTQIENMLRSLGFTNITIKVKKGEL